jgi:hypothetical protein
METYKKYLTENLNEAYKVAQNPSDKLWYVLGDLKGTKYWMPVSSGFKSKAQADKYAKKQPASDQAAKSELAGV